MDPIKEKLNKVAGAIFLTQSKLISSYSITNDMLKSFSIDYEKVAKYELISRLTTEMVNKFEKEIKQEEYYDGKALSLELHIFPTSALKLAVEYIISEMPQSELDRIRQNKI